MYQPGDSAAQLNNIRAQSIRLQRRLVSSVRAVPLEKVINYNRHYYKFLFLLRYRFRALILVE